MSFLANLESEMEAWWKTKVVPVLEGAKSTAEADLATAGKEEAQAVAGAVTTASTQVGEEVIADIATGNASKAGAAAGQLLIAAAKNLEGTTAQIGMSTLLEGVKQGVTSIQNSPAAVAAKAGS